MELNGFAMGCHGSAMANPWQTHGVPWANMGYFCWGTLLRSGATITKSCSVTHQSGTYDEMSGSH